MNIQQYLTLSCLLILMVSCKDKEAPQEKLVRPVKYEKVTYLGGDKSRVFSGTAKTEKIINLSFRSSGIITMLDMKLGQKVKKGQLLGKLDNVSARLNYESAIEQKNSSESQMNTAKLNLNRVRKLYEKGSASLSDYEDAKNSYRTAVASFESAKRSVAIQQDQIQFGYLYAPEDGAIASVIAEIDENVSPGQQIAVLNAGSAIEISLGIPESVINAVKKDMIVMVDFTAIPNEKFEAVVTEVAPALDVNTSTYPVTVQIKDSDERIKSGMASNVFFEFKEDSVTERVIVVPASAVGENSEGRFVFLVEDEGDKTMVKKHTIEIGELTPQGFEVKKGLKKGQKVATAGLQTLLDGQEVKLK
ncbi:efflux RND transporter periplasmic adaptor subunit [Winogradskyella aurantia]|uniref:Efflux transporter periplasmic adaptor subunit n=1 Tax=Winogradskyella aurantia TaxID=1915063 RepID=A0A265URH3_9FLAO|nr:efflux RND transporter periplasmic adaptor subunit [Winogradskyella aurantia]OZV67677.1 efflux transporter periplasmic adaptor subunit [Winogradskyella aurantia]